jgi:hypothetical protein
VCTRTTRGSAGSSATARTSGAIFM